MDTGERPAKRLRSVVITPAAKQAIADAEKAPAWGQQAAARDGLEHTPDMGGLKQPLRSAWREKWERRRAAELAENAPPAANGVLASARSDGKEPDALDHRMGRSRSPGAGHRRSEGSDARPRRRARAIAVPVGVGSLQGIAHSADQGPHPRSPAELAPAPAGVEGGAGLGAAHTAGALDASLDAHEAPTGACPSAGSPDAGPAKKRSRWEAAAAQAAGPGAPADAGGGRSAALLSSPEVPSPLAMAAALAAAQEDAQLGAANGLPPQGGLSRAEGHRALAPAQRLPPPPPLVAEGKRLAGSGAGFGLGTPMRALDQEVLEFARALAPDRSEAAVREAAFQRVASACRAAHLPDVQAFGSRACGLELWNSDIDIAVLGVLEPAAAHGGFTEGQKRDACWYLEAVVRELHERRSVQKTLLIRQARIPIVKVTTVEGVDVDVSINDAGGVHTAALVSRHMAAFPALRPLALTLKALLRAAAPAALNDVATGGLGSYSLVNMLVAHLMLDAQEGGAPGEWGRLLLGFLERFGRRFNYDAEAVAVGRGGIVPKASVPLASVRDSMRLCIEDPLTGRDIAAGTTRIAAVRDAFAAAASVLRAALARSAAAPDAPPLPLLSQVFNVRAALSPRSPLLAKLALGSGPGLWPEAGLELPPPPALGAWPDVEVARPQVKQSRKPGSRLAVPISVSLARLPMSNGRTRVHSPEQGLCSPPGVRKRFRSASPSPTSSDSGGGAVDTAAAAGGFGLLLGSGGNEQMQAGGASMAGEVEDGELGADAMPPHLRWP